MGNFSSKKSGSKKGGEITELDRAILNLKTQRRKLNDQRGRLEALNERERAAVRELLAAQRKGRALLALKKVKLQEGQMDAIDTYLMRVEEQLVGIETTRETKALFDTLRAGADALKACPPPPPLPSPSLSSPSSAIPLRSCSHPSPLEVAASCLAPLPRRAHKPR